MYNTSLGNQLEDKEALCKIVLRNSTSINEFSLFPPLMKKKEMQIDPMLLLEKLVLSPVACSEAQKSASQEQHGVTSL